MRETLTRWLFEPVNSMQDIVSVLVSVFVFIVLILLITNFLVNREMAKEEKKHNLIYRGYAIKERKSGKNKAKIIDFETWHSQK